MTLVCRELDLDPKRYPAAVVRRPGQQPEERAGRPRDARGRPGRGHAHRADARRGLRALPAAAARGQRARLRRPDHDDGQPAAGLPGRRRALPAPVPARAGRRVPGHQPRPVRAGPRADAAGRGDPPTPAELCVVGDADQSIYAFRGATIRNILEFEDDYPDATTILLEQNYRSTQTILSAANAVIARNPDRKPKNLWTDAGDGRADRRLRRRQRARRGGVRRRARSTGCTTTTRRRSPATSRCSTGPTRSPGCSRRCSSGSACRTRWSAACASTSGARSATRSPTCGCSPTPTTRCQLRRILNTPKRGIGDRAEACVEALAERERITFGAALRARRRGAGHRDPLASRAISDFVALIDELRTLVEAGAGAGRAARGGARPDRLPRRAARPATTRRTSPGSRTCASSSAVAREFEERGDPDGDALTRLPRAGLAGRRRRRGARDADDQQRRRRHADDAAHREGAGVPGRLPDRPRGRRLPAHALARRPERAGGGAPARLRRHHPGPAAALPVAGAGRAARGGSRRTTRPSGSSTRCRRSWSTGAGRSRR